MKRNEDYSYPQKELLGDVAVFVIHLRDHIAGLKKSDGVRQIDVAEKMGWSSQRLSVLLKKTSIGLKDYLNVCIVLGVDPRELITKHIPQYQNDEAAVEVQAKQPTNFGDDIIGALAEQVAKRLREK
ncbi:MAG: hypothetical protein COA58_03245 [Bacteroidetes bacterium]|nr:MAG: hypothetical protein COA58_03245 [Bacteroidota bacterium]